jgi:hypothetical protein
MLAKNIWGSCHVFFLEKNFEQWIAGQLPTRIITPNL